MFEVVPPLAILALPYALAGVERQKYEERVRAVEKELSLPEDMARVYVLAEARVNLRNPKPNPEAVKRAGLKAVELAQRKPWLLPAGRPVNLAAALTFGETVDAAVEGRAPRPTAAGEDDKPKFPQPPAFIPEHDPDNPDEAAVIRAVYAGMDPYEAQDIIRNMRAAAAGGGRGPWSNPPAGADAPPISPPPRQRPGYIPDDIKFRFGDTAGSSGQSEELIFVEKADDLKKIFEHLATRLGAQPLTVPGEVGLFIFKDTGLMLSDGHIVQNPEGAAGGSVTWSAKRSKYAPDGPAVRISYMDGNTFKTTKIYVEPPWFLPPSMQFEDAPAAAGLTRRLLVNNINDLQEIMHHLGKQPGTTLTLVRPSGVDPGTGRLAWVPVSGFPTASGAYGTDATFPNGYARWRNTGDPITKDGPYIEIKDDKNITKIQVKGREHLNPFRMWLWWSHVKY
jgi:hypothetical protein